ncbi:MAG: DUF4352 domain-containing protein, partial [Nanoarchaeota archaeon]
MEQAKKAWYKRWWAICIYVFVGLIILANILPDTESNSSIKDNTIKTAVKEAPKVEASPKTEIASVADNPVKKETSLPLKSSEEVVTEQPKPQQEFKLGDKIVVSDFTWKITKITKLKAIGEDIAGTFFGKEASGEFLIIDVEVENTGKSAEYLMDSFIKLVDDQEREFSPDTGAAFFLKPGGSALMFELVNPGIVKKGKIVFDVPEGLKIVNARISDN